MNKARADRGLAALTVDACATGFAQTLSDKNASTGSTEHQDLGPIRDKCAGGAGGAAENIYPGQTDPAKVVEGWMDSQGHRQNILGDSTHVGVGVATSPDGTMFSTAVFWGK